MKKVEKVILPIAGLATRFLPLSKGVPKEIWPLVDKPVLVYILEEILKSSFKEIILVLSPQKKQFWDYLSKENLNLKKILKERGKKELLKELEEFEKSFKKINFKEVFQKKPLGDGDAILKAKNQIKNEPFAVAFGDDVIESKRPALLQMVNVFKKYQKPVLGLFRVEKKKVTSYGIVKVEKLKERIYRIKEIVEKPKIKQAPSNLAIVGRYILTPEIFDYLRKIKKDEKKEIILAEALQLMLKENKEILGYCIEGKWLECGNKIEYLKSNLYLTLKKSPYKKELRKFARKILRA
jgi:UTP--glucose-1-phosphate uridylyltransferase